MIRRSPANKSPEKRSLKEKAYGAIKDRIQNNKFLPGEFLSERQLAELLGMSKTPIKAAIERLEQEGFVRVAPQQGIVVRELSVQEIADQFELREALESFVVRAISGKLTPAQQEEFESNLSAQKVAAKAGAMTKMVELDGAFHLLICDVFGNAAISNCIQQQRSITHRIISKVISSSPNRAMDTVAEHRAIYSAIQSGNRELAVERVVRHLDFGKQYLLKSKWAQQDQGE
jgi:GntR family transcriptional regulator, rspAB operon transcriptional repressor